MIACGVRIILIGIASYARNAEIASIADYFAIGKHFAPIAVTDCQMN